MSSFKKVRAMRLDWTKILLIEAYRFSATSEWVEYQKGYRRNWSSQFGMMRYFLRSLLLQSESEIEEVTRNARIDVLFFKSLSRLDFDRLYEAVLTSVPSGHVVQSFEVKSPRKNQFNLRAAVNLLIRCRELIHLVFSLGMFEGFYYYVKIVHHCTILDSLKELRPRVVVVFADMQPLDNAVAQFFKKKGVKTATLQHGLYVDYGGTDTINRANYENVVCDYFLAWGEVTSDLIRMHHPSKRVLNCGHPVMNPSAVPLDSGLSFFIFLDQRLFAAENQRLLNIATEFAEITGWRGNVGVHPRDSISNYQVNSTFLQLSEDTWEKYSFALGHTSSILYQALRLGVVVFQMESKVPCHRLPKELTFGSSAELIEKWENAPVPEFIGESYISKVGVESMKNYSKFFQLHE